MQTLSGLQQGNTLTITVGETLGPDLFKSFRQLYEAPAAAVDTYIVDLGQTRHLDSAGGTMLLLLRDHAGGERNHVRLVNASSVVRKDLKAMNFDLLFAVA